MRSTDSGNVVALSVGIRSLMAEQIVAFNTLTLASVGCVAAAVESAAIPFFSFGNGLSLTGAGRLGVTFSAGNAKRDVGISTLFSGGGLLTSFFKREALWGTLNSESVDATGGWGVDCLPATSWLLAISGACLSKKNTW